MRVAKSSLKWERVPLALMQFGSDPNGLMEVSLSSGVWFNLRYIRGHICAWKQGNPS